MSRPLRIREHLLNAARENLRHVQAGEAPRGLPVGAPVRVRAWSVLVAAVKGERRLLDEEEEKKNKEGKEKIGRL